MESLFAYEARLHVKRAVSTKVPRSEFAENFIESLAVQKVDHFTATVAFAAEFVLDLNQGTYSTTV